MSKGFTLVELLAVIVILAVLALIATPVVLSIIDDTKESAMLRSAEMYLSGVENAVMRENMNSGGNFRPSECTITNGNMTCGSTSVEVEVDGEVPSTGSIVFENGKITQVTLTYESGTIVKDASGALVYEGSEALAPGLYAEDGTMTYSWQELIDGGYLIVNNGALKADHIEYNGTAIDVLIGKLVISDSITNIESGAFLQCINLTSVEIPKSVTSIGSSAFYDCTNLKSVVIGSGVTNIGTSAFLECRNLESIYFEFTSVPELSEECFWSNSNVTFYFRNSEIANGVISKLEDGLHYSASKTTISTNYNW